MEAWTSTLVQPGTVGRYDSVCRGIRFVKFYYFSGEAHISNLIVAGITKFVVSELALSLTNRISVSATVLFESITIGANFSADVLLFNTIPIYADSGYLK